MGATTFHRDIAIVSGDQTTKSAKLAIEEEGEAVKVRVTELDGTAVTTDTAAVTSCVHVAMPVRGNFTLVFKLPGNATTATYKSGNDDPKEMDGGTTATPSFDVTNDMIDKAVMCVLEWKATGPAGPVTITVRPRASTQPVPNDLSV